MARKMKDSGIQWVGDIPSHWNMVKTNSFCSTITDYVASGSFASLAENVVYLDEPDYAMLVRTMDVSGKGYSGKPVYINKHSYDFLSNSNLFGGEIMLPNIGASVGDVYIVPKLYERMSLAPNAIMVKTTVCDKFVYYYFYSDAGRLSLLDIAQSTAQPKFNKTDFRQLRIAMPSKDEQEKIANLLDEKCQAIDAVISKTKATIEEYRQLKQSIVINTVTRGFYTNCQMKNSGIEWIGDIPSHWGVKSAFQLFSQVKNKNEGLVEQNLLSLSYGKIKRRSIDAVGGLLPENFDGYNIIEQDDIVLRLTDLQNDHTSLRVGLSPERGIVTSAYLTLRNQSANTPLYLYYYLHSFDLCKGFYGMGAGVRQGLNWDGLKQLKIVVPPIEEQIKITDYLEKKCAEIDTLIAQKTALLEEMETYKKSVIYEYVTGKKEVTV